MEALEESPEITEPAMRTPLGLRILCVLLWLGSLMRIILALGVLAGGAAFVKWARIPVVDTILRDDVAGSPLYLSLKVLFFAASVIGVWLIWKLKKRGLWIYLTAELTLLLLPIIFLHPLGLSYLMVKLILSAIFTLLFIFLLSFHFKKLK